MGEHRTRKQRVVARAGGGKRESRIALSGYHQLLFTNRHVWPRTLFFVFTSHLFAEQELLYASINTFSNYNKLMYLILEPKQPNPILLVFRFGTTQPVLRTGIREHVERRAW